MSLGDIVIWTIFLVLIGAEVLLNLGERAGERFFAWLANRLEPYLRDYFAKKGKKR